jgi:cardiolipin synthase
MKGSGFWNAPNLVTLSRLVLAPFVIREIILGHGVTAFLLLALASFTDLLDGWLARSTANTTGTGQLLDPIADKMLLSGVFLAFAYVRLVPMWFVILVFGRDIYLLAASAIVVRSTGVQGLRPSVWGKLSTILQLATAGLYVCGNAFPGIGFRTAAEDALWPTAFFTLLSGLHYTWRGSRYLMDGRENPVNPSPR